MSWSTKDVSSAMDASATAPAAAAAAVSAAAAAVPSASASAAAASASAATSDKVMSEDYLLAWQLQAEEYQRSFRQGTEKADEEPSKRSRNTYRIQIKKNGSLESKQDVEYELLFTRGDRDCFFHAVNHSLKQEATFNRKTLVDALLQNVTRLSIIAAFVLEIRQFLYIGYVNKHEDPDERAACAKVITAQIRDLFKALSEAEELVRKQMVIAKKELGNISNGKNRNEVLKMLQDRRSALFHDFSQANAAVNAFDAAIFTACRNTDLFRNYITYYLRDARGYIPFPRDFGGGRLTPIDAVNELFGLKIQVYLRDRDSSGTLFLANKAETGEIIPIFHNGTNHFSGLKARVETEDKDEKRLIESAKVGEKVKADEKTDKDQRTHRKTKQEGSKKTVSEEGLFAEVFRDELLHFHSRLKPEHQLMLDRQLYQHYYVGMKLKVDLWHFGFMDFMETLCCGQLLPHADLFAGLKSNKTFHCPNPECPSHVQSKAKPDAADVKEKKEKKEGEESKAMGEAHEVVDQLFCMGAVLAPHTQNTSREELTLEIMRKAIVRKRYFLLMNLLAIESTARYLNRRDSYGRALLHYALFENDCIAALILIMHGAEVNAKLGIQYPIAHLQWAEKHGNKKRDFRDLKNLLICYGSRHDARSLSWQHSAPDPYQETRLHSACVRVSDDEVHYLLREGGVNVNYLNSSNHTALQELARSHAHAENRQALSVLNLYIELKKLNFNDSDIFELLFLLHEQVCILYDDEKTLYQFQFTNADFRPNLDVNDDIFEYFKAYGRQYRFGENWGLFFKRDPEQAKQQAEADSNPQPLVYLCSTHNMDLNDPDPNRVFKKSEYAEGDILDWVMEQALFKGRVIVPCPFKEFHSPAVIEVAKNKDDISLTLDLNSDPKHLSPIFCKKIEAWVRSKFPKATITVVQNDKPYGYSKTRVGFFLIVLKRIYEVLGQRFDEKDLMSKYFQYRCAENVFLRDKLELKRLGDVLGGDPRQSTGKDDSKKASFVELLHKLLKTTKQDFIIQLLYEQNAETQVSLARREHNVFCLAGWALNYRFMKKLCEYRNPFPQQRTKPRIEELPYHFFETCLLLEWCAPQSSAIETFFQLIDGKAKLKSGQDEAIFLELWMDRDKKLFEEANKNGETPVFIAIRSLNLNGVIVLLEKGVCLLVKNKKGQFPIDVLFEVDKGFRGAIQDLFRQKMQEQITKDIRLASTKRRLTDQDLKYFSDRYQLLTRESLTKHSELIFVARTKIKPHRKKVNDSDASDADVEMADADPDVKEDAETERLNEEREAEENEDGDENEGPDADEGEDDGEDEDEDDVDNPSSESKGFEESKAYKDYLTREVKEELYYEMMMNPHLIKAQLFAKLAQLKTMRLQPLANMLDNTNELLDCIVSVLQLLDHQSSQARAKKDELVKLESQCLETLTKVLNLFPNKAQIILQLLLTVGMVSEARKTKLMHTLGDFLRGTARAAQSNKSDYLFSFYCDLWCERTEHLEGYLNDGLGFTEDKVIDRCRAWIKVQASHFFMARRLGLCCLSTFDKDKLQFSADLSPGVGAALVESQQKGVVLFGAAAAAASGSAPVAASVGAAAGNADAGTDAAAKAMETDKPSGSEDISMKEAESAETPDENTSAAATRKRKSQA